MKEIRNYIIQIQKDILYVFFYLRILDFIVLEMCMNVGEEGYKLRKQMIREEIEEVLME